jgi:hypothetical protein
MAMASVMVMTAVPAHAGRSKTIALSPTGVHNLAVFENASHGPLIKFAAWYADGQYRHVDVLPAGSDVIDINMVTCVNLGPCGDRIDADDGTAGSNRGDGSGVVPGSQKEVSVHHNATTVDHPQGQGRTLYVEHYEHGKEGQLNLWFKDGFELCITIRPGSYVVDIDLTTIGGDSSSGWQSVDGGNGGI